MELGRAKEEVEREADAAATAIVSLSGWYKNPSCHDQPVHLS
jgi:hypothetical protein